MRTTAKYEALVSASTREEAIAIALEGLAPDQEALQTDARDVSASEGPGSFHVTIVFRSTRSGGEGIEG